MQKSLPRGGLFCAGRDGTNAVSPIAIGLALSRRSIFEDLIVKPYDKVEDDHKRCDQETADQAKCVHPFKSNIIFLQDWNIYIYHFIKACDRLRQQIQNE